MNALETPRMKELLAACLERIENEGEGALDAFCREHPELEERARAGVSALRSVGFLGAPSSDDDFPERLGPFRLVRRLGAGGMGVVYLAEQMPLGREVALKLIRPDQLYFPGARERFRREIDAIARLDHPGIAAVHAFGEERGLPYFAMEPIPGASLASIIERMAGRRVPPDERWTRTAFGLIRQVADALAHAHARGVIHRDVKPSNVMVTRDERAVLVDFGLARASGTSRITRTGSQLGSFHYMAPEQISRGGEEIDERTDVYALGVVLYEALALCPPFHSENADELRRLVRRGASRDLRELNPAVSRDAAVVCAKAMDADPSFRYASMADFAVDLDHLLAGRPIAGRRPSRMRRALARISRRA